MTPFPQLPTDNLYKFIAIAGLGMFITCVIVKSQNTLATNEMLSKEGQATEDRMGAFMSKTTDQAAIDQVIKKERGKFSVRAKVIRDEAAYLDWWFGLGFFFGLAMTFYGFVMWYLRVQKLQDAMLRFQHDREAELWRRMNAIDEPRL